MQAAVIAADAVAEILVLYKIADSVRNSMTEIAVVNYHRALPARRGGF